MSKKNYFFIYLCITIFFVFVCLLVNNNRGEKFLETIDIEDISLLEISFREKNVLCNDCELINEFKSIVQKLAVEKDASVRMKREMRNLYIFAFTKGKELYKLHISYPDSKAYVFVYLVGGKYTTNLCCELQEKDWLAFNNFIKKCNEIINYDIVVL